MMNATSMLWCRSVPDRLTVIHNRQNNARRNGNYILHVFWGGSRGGGPGVQGPPLVPREGVLDPSSKMKKTAFIIFSFI